MSAAPNARVELQTSRELSADDVLKVAALARLALTPEQVQVYRSQLQGVLTLMDKLREVDVSEVEPLNHPGEQAAALAADEPGLMLTDQAFMAIAPEAMDGFLKIPKVLGDGGGA